jgi:hypothetical protein
LPDISTARFWRKHRRAWQKVVQNNPQSEKQNVIWQIILRDFWGAILRGAPTQTSAVSAFCVDCPYPAFATMSTQTNTTSNSVVWFDVMNAIDVVQCYFDSSRSRIPMSNIRADGLTFLPAAQRRVYEDAG